MASRIKASDLLSPSEVMHVLSLLFISKDNYLTYKISRRMSSLLILDWELLLRSKEISLGLHSISHLLSTRDIIKAIVGGEVLRHIRARIFTLHLLLLLILLLLLLLLVKLILLQLL